MSEEVARQSRGRARLDGDAGRQPRLAAHDRVAAAGARDRGADHRAPRARRRADHRAAAAAASPSRRSPNGELHGVEAVIDKDRASALLAIEMKADLLMIPTGVERVAIRFGAARSAVARPHHRGAKPSATRPKDTSAPAAWDRRSRRIAQVRPGPARRRAASSPTPRTSRARCAARPAPGSTADQTRTKTMETTLLAVNGTLMRGLELNPNLLAVGATFVREDADRRLLPPLVDRRPPSGDAAHAGRRRRAWRSSCGRCRSPGSRRSC